MGLEFMLHPFCAGFKGANAKLASGDEADIRFQVVKHMFSVML
jgi:hypothetical protein